MIRFRRLRATPATQSSRPDRRTAGGRPGIVVSSTLSRSVTGLLAAVAALALSVDVAGILATTGGSSATASSRPVLASRALPAAPESSAAPTNAPGSGSQPVAEKPPPVVDGVQRTNVGSAHSPQT